ncbi:ATP-dependent zinc protease family protein [Cognatilysobacter terrigena]|uniref:ATP-dependent zinc protease family protein n=1 Tax=Cognatilysobacter terrigena TaxID=2488749 RepID=UPI001AAC9F0C|nr:RimK/LysX family protein [Lysobacter terrigena]
MDTASSRIVVGWRERVALPDLGLAALRAKIDTGARTSALHVDAQWRFEQDGAPWVGFRISPGGRQVVELTAPVHDERDVVDSGGHRTTRIFLRMRMRLASVERDIEVNLADRRGMRFPMLIGRTALSGIFTVDPSRSFLHGRAPRRSPLPALP